MMNDKVKAALDLARRGFRVFPLVPNGKTPLITKFYDKATVDREKIISAWTKLPRNNIGICTTRHENGSHLIIVDVDNKPGKDGNQSVLNLGLEGFEFPKTLTQFTPSGGRHFIYFSTTPVSNSTEKIAPAIDIRSFHGYVAGAGSRTDKGVYTIDDTPIANAPEWLIQKAGEARTNTAQLIKCAPISSVDRGVIIKKCMEYLDACEPAVEGGGGDAQTFKVASHLRSLGANETLAFDLLRDNWNEKCSPPWDLNDLWQKVINAFSYATEPVGNALAEVQFPPTNVEGPSELHDMNRRFALVLRDKNHVIMEEINDEFGHVDIREYSEETFKVMFMEKINRNDKLVRISDAWLTWAGRRTYKQMVFSPNRKLPRDIYNMWRGFRVKPVAYDRANPKAKAGFDAFMEHLYNNVANGIKEHADYILGFFAHIFQKPEEKPLVTLVFQGGKGVGKNALIERVGKLLHRENFIVADSDRYLFSNFNGHFEKCLLFVSDEAFWGGDARYNGKLKGLTTGETILIEKKNREPYAIKNLTRVVLLGNEEWLVPASDDERRYAVFKLGDGRKQDREFFRNMRENIDDFGGNEVLLHYFLNFDLSTVDVNDAPVTEALLSQKEESLDVIQEFIKGSLSEGSILESYTEGWPETMPIRTVRSAYVKYSKIQGSRYPGKETKLLSKLKPFITESKTVRTGNDTQKHYVFKPLAECRRIWDEMFGTKNEWL